METSVQWKIHSKGGDYEVLHLTNIQLFTSSAVQGFKIMWNESFTIETVANDPGPYTVVFKICEVLYILYTTNPRPIILMSALVGQQLHSINLNPRET